MSFSSRIKIKEIETMKYKYLFWDIDGTVLDFLAAEAAAIKKLFIEHGLGECSDEMLASYSKINRKYWQALERNEMSKERILVARFEEFFESQGITKDGKVCNKEEIIEIARKFNDDYQVALGDTIAYCDNAKEVLLEEAGEYILVAITNGTAVAQRKKLRNSGLDLIFDFVFISEDVGVEKPNPGYFEHALAAAGVVDKSQVLIIGDSLTSDIQGGVNMGIDTCLYDPRHKWDEASAKPPIPTYVINHLSQVADIIR